MKSNTKGKPLKGKSKEPQFMIGSQTNIFDRKEIVEKQNKLKKLFQLNRMSQNSRSSVQFQHYSKIKFQFTVYSLGEYIELYSLNTTTNESYIAKLTKIIKPNGIADPKAFIEVEWVLRKSDLPENILFQFGEYISSAEVFPSKEKVYLYVESIKCKCTVLDAQEYGQLGLTSQNIYYTRSGYDNVTKKIVPDPSTWDSDCQCKKPNNPDLIYVECSKCARWFHQKCVQPKIINGHFLCDNCFSAQDA